MGKGVMLLAVAMLLTGAVLLNNARRSSLESHKRQALHEDDVLAKQIARAGLEVAISKVKMDFENWRSGFDDVEYLGGTYDVTVSGPAEGPVVITSTGTHNGVTRQMSATLVRKSSNGGAIDAAIMLDIPAIEPKFKDYGFLISGNDHLPPSEGGGSGSGEAVHGIKSVLASIEQAIEDDLESAQEGRIEGKGASPDVVSGALSRDLGELFEELLAEVSPGNMYEGGTFKNTTFGSPSNPGVFFIDGEARFKKTVRGYGVLLIDGEKFEAKDSFEWEGLVLVRNSDSDDGEIDVKLDDYSTIYGALGIIASCVGDDEDEGEGDSEDAGLPGGHFDVDVFDAPTTKEEYHEHQYDDKFDVTYVDIAKDSRLLYNTLVGPSYPNDIRVEFFNAANGSGTYLFKAGGTTLSGNTQSGFSTTFTPSELEELRVDFASLEDLRDTEPKNVQNDVPTRDQAFAVRMYDTVTDALVYELAVYHHVKDNDGGDDDDGDDDGKVYVCHIPPGNPDNAHTIEIDESALPAHLAHGDTEGKCEGDDDDDDGDDEMACEDSEVKLEFKDNAKVLYSTKALQNAGILEGTRIVISSYRAL